METLEDMLGAWVLQFKRNNDTHLSLMEFAYNNNYRWSIEWLLLKHCTVGNVDL